MFFAIIKSISNSQLKLFCLWQFQSQEAQAAVTQAIEMLSESFESFFLLGQKMFCIQNEVWVDFRNPKLFSFFFNFIGFTPRPRPQPRSCRPRRSWRRPRRSSTLPTREWAAARVVSSGCSRSSNPISPSLSLTPKRTRAPTQPTTTSTAKIFLKSWKQNLQKFVRRMFVILFFGGIIQMFIFVFTQKLPAGDQDCDRQDARQCRGQDRPQKLRQGYAWIATPKVWERKCFPDVDAEVVVICWHKKCF